MHESESEREVAQSCPTLRDPMDRSLPGSSVHGIFQARVLEWGAIAFSVSFLEFHINGVIQHVLFVVFPLSEYATASSFSKCLGYSQWGGSIYEIKLL